MSEKPELGVGSVLPGSKLAMQISGFLYHYTFTRVMQCQGDIKGSKHPTIRYLPTTIITIPNIEPLDTL